MLSAQKRKEKLHWKLELYCVSFYETEEEKERNGKFSVPTNVVMEKMYDLSEFEDKGIFLSPYPTGKLPSLKESDPIPQGRE